MPSQPNATNSLVDHEGVVPLARHRPAPAQPAPAPAFESASAAASEAPPAVQSALPAPAPQRTDSAAIGALTAIASVLASRLILLLAVVGGFVLALRVVDPTGIWLLGVYCALIVLPLVALDVLTRRKGA